MRRIVRGVQRLECHPNERDANPDDGAAADLETRRSLDDANLLARQQQTHERIRQLVKREKLLGCSPDDAAGGEVHRVILERSARTFRLRAKARSTILAPCSARAPSAGLESPGKVGGRKAGHYKVSRRPALCGDRLRGHKTRTSVFPRSAQAPSAGLRLLSAPSRAIAGRDISSHALRMTIARVTRGNVSSLSA